ncbi:MAG: hypothetical protein NZO16_04475, partial [Deltaproteobacteria bacterium]|nr:hypothetical protein [Deltaproteobacteria bacterium]
LDELCKVHPERMKTLESFLSKWKMFKSDLRLDFNLNSKHPWILRKFIPKLLENSPLNSEMIIDEFLNYHRLGLIHGHLKPSNIGISNDKLILLDPCVSIVFPWRDTKYLAPEKTVSVAADIFSLASLLSESSDLNQQTRAFVLQGLSQEPSKRPDIKMLLCAVSNEPTETKLRTSTSYGSKKNLIPLVLVFFVILAGIIFLRFKGVQDPVKPPEITQAELSKAITDKNTEILKVIAEYLVQTGDQNYFSVLISLLRRIPSNSALPRFANNLFQSIEKKNLRKEDIQAISAIIFFDYLSPTVFQELNFSSLSFNGVMALTALSINLPEGINLTVNLTSDPKELQLIKILHELGHSDIKSPLFKLISSLEFGVCDDNLMSNLIKAVPLKNTFVALRVYFDQFGFQTHCQDALFNSLSASTGLKEWFAGSTLVDWKNVSVDNKLMITLGLSPQNLDQTYLLDLIKFPLNEISNKAFEASEKLCTNDICKRSFPVLFRFKEDLSREQLLTLGSLILSSEREQNRYVATWYSLNPSPNLVLELLLARDSLAKDDPITFFGVSFLLTRDFNVSFPQKVKLTTHRDPKIRRFGVLKLDPTIEEDKSLLNKLKDIEDDHENKKLIMEKLRLVENANKSKKSDRNS